MVAPRTATLWGYRSLFLGLVAVILFLRLLPLSALPDAWPLPEGGFIDYDRVRDHISGWRGRDHVELLETLVEELIGVCFALPPVEACRVRITKPHIFPEAAGAGVEIFRRRPG